MGGSLWSEIIGVVGTVFQWNGPNGPIINYNSSAPVALEFKNATNNAFVLARCADPQTPSLGTVADNDVVDKHYTDRDFVKSFLLMGG